MAKRKLTDKLISLSSIKEEMKLIEGSDTDYVTPSGQVYSDYGNNMFLHKKTHINNHNGYTYCGIHFPSGNKQRRVHVLVAKAFLSNPNDLPVVGHKNNIKSSTDINNLYWTTVKENTQKAFDDGLAINAAGFDDSQSYQIDVYSLNGRYIKTIGSVTEASREYGVSKSTVLRHCRKEVNKYRIDVTFRFQNEDF